MKANPLSVDPRTSTIDEASDEKLLELLLCYSEPEAAKKAQELLAGFGNIANLLDATSKELVDRHTLDRGTVNLIRLVSMLHRRYLLIRSRTEVILQDHTAIAQYLMPLFSGETTEVLYLLSLSGARMVLGCTKLNSGSLEQVNVHIRTLVKDAIDKNASYIVLAHNHPTGLQRPSTDDISTTSTVRELLMPFGITLLDHIIFSNDNYLSMRECGYLLF